MKSTEITFLPHFALHPAEFAVERRIGLSPEITRRSGAFRFSRAVNCGARMMTGWTTLRGRLPAMPVSNRNFQVSDVPWTEPLFGDLRLGLVTSMASWAVVLAPFLG